MTKFNLTTIGFAALLAIGCGSDENPTNSSKENIPSTPASAFDSLIVQSAANLPACDAGREGRAFFVQNENLPRLCVKGIWRSAADTTDFSITCSDGFLHAQPRHRLYRRIHFSDDRYCTKRAVRLWHKRYRHRSKQGFQHRDLSKSGRLHFHQRRALHL